LNQGFCVFSAPFWAQTGFCAHSRAKAVPAARFWQSTFDHLDKICTPPPGSQIWC